MNTIKWLWICVMSLNVLTLQAEDAAPISLELSSERTTYVSGEAVPVTLRITNTSDKDLTYMKQGTFMTTTDITVKTKDGMTVKHNEDCWVYGTPFFGKGASRTMAAGQWLEGKASMGRIHDLNAGEYVVTATVHQVESKEFGLIPITVSSKPLNLTIKELIIQQVVTREVEGMTYGVIVCGDELYAGRKLTGKAEWSSLVKLGIPRKTLDGITWGAKPQHIFLEVPGEGGTSTIVTVIGDDAKSVTAQPIQKADILKK